MLITSNTSSVNVLPAAGMQVITLTSVSGESPLAGLVSVGDEWVVDTQTDGGLNIIIRPDGTYTVPGLPGEGPQVFQHFFVDVSNSYVHSSILTENIAAVPKPLVVSNTFPVTVQPAVGQSVTKITSVALGSTIEGILTINDEWVGDTYTDGGVLITYNPDGTYSVPDITGLGNQTFSWFGNQINEGYTHTQLYLETIIDPATVAVPPAITTQPQNQTIEEGSGSVTFSVVATGIPAPTYQWRKNGFIIDGATSDSYTVYGADVTTANSGDYYTVRVTNPSGAITSSSAILTVTALPALATIVSNPVPGTVTEGQVSSHTFSVSVTSDSPVTYQWQKWISGMYVNISGATSSSYVVQGVTSTVAADHGVVHRCVITNDAGSVYSEGATLSVVLPVNPAPTGTLTATEITDSSFNVRFTANESGTFRLVVVINNSTLPTTEQVLNGTAPGILRSSSVAVMTAGVEVVTPIIGLGVFTPYDVYAVLVDQQGNERLLDRLDVQTTRDTTIPVIELLGSYTMYVPLGSTFVDPGAILTDNVDADLPISGSGTVLQNTLGTYYRTYDGADAEGNIAETVTRTVIVYDPTLIDSDGGIITDVMDETSDEVTERIIE